MIRAVLAVLVAVALLAPTMPALSDARAQTTHQKLAGIAAELTRTANELEAGSTAVDDRELAARTTLQLTLPAGFDAAPVETAAIGCPAAVLSDERDPPPGCTAALAYRLRGGEASVHEFPGVEVRTPEGPVRLSNTPVRLELRYVRVDDVAIVEVTRADSSRTEV